MSARGSSTNDTALASSGVSPATNDSSPEQPVSQSDGAVRIARAVPADERVLIGREAVEGNAALTETTGS
ncbi:MAG TPA: hypothetical protein VK524_16545, partial [Polyangiaceae bacterium]|nr:hypothetical protein [Polyangiaceae bacterium]